MKCNIEMKGVCLGTTCMNSRGVENEPRTRCLEELSIFHNSCSVFRFQYNRVSVLDFCHYHDVTYLAGRKCIPVEAISRKSFADSEPNFSHKGIVNTGGRLNFTTNIERTKKKHVPAFRFNPVLFRIHCAHNSWMASKLSDDTI